VAHAVGNIPKMVPFLLDVLFEHRSLTQELLPAVVEPLSEGHLSWIVGLLLCCGYGVYGGGGDGESLPNGAEIASMAVAGNFQYKVTVDSMWALVSLGL